MSSNVILNNLHQDQKQLPSLSKTLPSVRQRDYRGNSWSYTQQKIYTTFLKENINTIRTLHQRKCFRPFKKISKLVKTRTPVQVKSHHQKLVEKFGDLDILIAKMEQYLHKLQEKYEDHTEQEQQALDLFEGILFQQFKPCIFFTPLDAQIKLEAQLEENVLILQENQQKRVYKIHLGQISS